MGLLPLAYLLDDPVLVAKARKFIDWTLDHQRADGRIGPEKPPSARTRCSDWWPNMVMLKALTQYQEVTGDPRVIPAYSKKYFAYQAAVSWQEKPVAFEWGSVSAGAMNWSLDPLACTTATATPKLLDLARQLAGQGFDWKRLLRQRIPTKTKLPKADLANMKSHGVGTTLWH